MKFLPSYHCAVTVKRGKLYVCPIDDKGAISMTAGCFNWRQISYPIASDFLQKINEVLRTNFCEEDVLKMSFEKQLM